MINMIQGGSKKIRRIIQEIVENRNKNVLIILIIIPPSLSTGLY